MARLTKKYKTIGRNSTLAFDEVINDSKVKVMSTILLMIFIMLGSVCLWLAICLTKLSGVQAWGLALSPHTEARGHRSPICKLKLTVTSQHWFEYCMR